MLQFFAKGLDVLAQRIDLILQLPELGMKRTQLLFDFFGDDMAHSLLAGVIDHGLRADRQGDAAEDQTLYVFPVDEPQKLGGALTVQLPAAQNGEQRGLFILKQGRSGGE